MPSPCQQCHWVMNHNTESFSFPLPGLAFWLTRSTSPRTNKEKGRDIHRIIEHPASQSISDKIDDSRVSHASHCTTHHCSDQRWYMTENVTYPACTWRVTVHTRHIEEARRQGGIQESIYIHRVTRFTCNEKLACAALIVMKIHMIDSTAVETK
jgi:hypothetical protein